jgi:hypothetical protein
VPEYTIHRFSLSQLRGQVSYQATMALEGRGHMLATVAAPDSEEALLRFLQGGGVEGRQIELPVVKDPTGQDAAWVEIGYELLVSRRVQIASLLDAASSGRVRGEGAGTIQSDDDPYLDSPEDPQTD